MIINGINMWFGVAVGIVFLVLGVILWLMSKSEWCASPPFYRMASLLILAMAFLAPISLFWIAIRPE